jgi:hypothetical protein
MVLRVDWVGRNKKGYIKRVKNKNVQTEKPLAEIQRAAF